MRKISKALTIVMVVLLVAPNIGAQNKTEKIKVYKIWVTKMDGSKVKGFFYAANEQGITISKSKVQDESNLFMVEARNISLIKMRRKGAVGKGAGIGFIAGVATGAIIGLADGDDGVVCGPGIFGGTVCREGSTAGEKATAGAIGLGVIGTGIGAIVGTGKKKIPIDGNAETYITQLNSLTNYTIKQD
jgi:hypothetical protein